MERKYQLKHIGEKFITNEGYGVEIIDGGLKPLYCKVMFLYNNYACEVQYGNISNGILSNPYHPSVSNIGYLGKGNHNSSNNYKAYTAWCNMIARCYNDKYQERHLTYRGVTVAKEWHNFQNFAEWYSKQYNPDNNFEIDKDLLSGNKKMYSPHTCCLIPSYLNTFMTNKQSTNTSGATGVTIDGKKYRARITDVLSGKELFLGNFDTLLQASQRYKEARKENIVVIKEKIKEEYPLLDKQILLNIK